MPVNTRVLTHAVPTVSTQAHTHARGGQAAGQRPCEVTPAGSSVVASTAAMSCQNRILNPSGFLESNSEPRIAEDREQAPELLWPDWHLPTSSTSRECWARRGDTGTKPVLTVPHCGAP